MFPCTQNGRLKIYAKNYATDGFKAVGKTYQLIKIYIVNSFTEHNQMFSLKPSTIISQVRNVIRL